MQAMLIVDKIKQNKTLIVYLLFKFTGYLVFLFAESGTLSLEKKLLDGINSIV